MSIDDADSAREGSERGRRNERFKDLLLSVQMDIRDAQKVGANSTTYKLSDTSMEFKDDLHEYLAGLDYNVTIDGARFQIAWPDPEH